MSDEANSPEPEQQEPPEQAADSRPEEQEPSASRSEPKSRLDGLMSSLGKRTTERDRAQAEAKELRAELEALRTELDTDYRAELGMEPVDEPEPVPAQPTVTPREAAQAQVRAAVDTNQPSRDAASRSEPGLDALRQALDASWARHAESIREV